MSARRAALGLAQWLGAAALFGAWLALAVVLPPGEFGAICLLLLACGAGWRRCWADRP